MSPSVSRALASGFVGAAAVNLLNEAARRRSPQAPRLDQLGKRGLARLVRRAGASPPRGEGLRLAALAGDLALNTLYYSLVGAGRGRPWLRGTLLGTGAGIGAVVLAPRLGLGRKPVARTGATRAMTVGWYLAGGLAAAAAAKALGLR